VCVECGWMGTRVERFLTIFTEQFFCIVANGIRC
jgi:hypothetical protein